MNARVKHVQPVQGLPRLGRRNDIISLRSSFIAFTLMIEKVYLHVRKLYFCGADVKSGRLTKTIKIDISRQTIAYKNTKQLLQTAHVIRHHDRYGQDPTLPNLTTLHRTTSNA